MKIRKRYNPVNLDMTPVKVHRGRVAVPEVAKRRTMKKVLIVTVAISTVLLFCVVALWILTEVGNSSKSKKQALTEVESGEYVYSEKDSLSVLVALTSDDAVTAEHFMLMRIDPSRWDNGEGYAVCFMSLPPEMAIDSSGTTLKSMYSLGGTAECAKTLRDISGAREIYSASVNYKTLRELIQAIGGITVTVEHNINYISPDGTRNFYTAAGTRDFNGSDGARMMYCTDWPGGVEEQRLMICRCFASMANKLISRKNSSYLDYYFKKITNTVSTNVSAGAYQEIKTGLYNFALDNDGEDITEIFLCGYEEDENGQIYLTEDGVKYLKALFGEHD